MSRQAQGNPFPPERDQCASSNFAWTTALEIEFINLIHEKANPAAFEGYAASLSKRKNWGRIDPKWVRHTVKCCQASRVA